MSINKKQQINLSTLKQTTMATGGLTMAVNPRTSTPTFLKAARLTRPAKGNTTSLTLSVRRADLFLQSNKNLLKLHNPSQELLVTSSVLDAFGKKHMRYSQVYKGIPLWGKEIIVHEDSNNAIYLFNGHYEETPLNLDVTPQITATDAYKTALKKMNVEATKGSHTPELTIYTSPDHQKKLTYLVHLNPRASVDVTYFIDAKTGEIINSINNICSLTGHLSDTSGMDIQGKVQNFKAVEADDTLYAIHPITYSDKQYSQKKQVTLHVYDAKKQDMAEMNESADVPIVTRTKSTPWDPAAVSALMNSRKTFTYFNTTFGRDSIDNKGMDIISVIHTGYKMNNAFLSSRDSIMYYGDGDGKILSNLTGGLDVAAHEMSHGVINHTANLVYQGQSGALNESFADFFGVMVDRDDWYLGEDVTLPEPGFIRNMATPSQALVRQPATMDGYVETEADNGGVHINSGIPNRAAYLIAEGLSHEGLGVSIGKEATEQIYYRALSHYLVSQAQFIDARRGLIQAAEDLHGKNSIQVSAVARAWDLVKVYDTGQPSAQEYTKPQPDQNHLNNRLNQQSIPLGQFPSQQNTRPTKLDDWIIDVN